MVENIWVIGSMENNMGKGNRIIIYFVVGQREYGMREKE
jgi:hypothetical protein